MAEDRPVAVVLGVDCLTGLQVARILWRKGVRVVGVARDPGATYCQSRALSRVLAVTVVEKDVPSFLRAVSADAGRPVLIPCSDEFVAWLDAHRDVCSPHADFVLPEHDTLELLADKSKFYRYATEHHLPLPDTQFASTMDEVRTLSEQMAFPLLIKPPRHCDNWMEASDGFKVLKVDTPEKLLEVAPGLLAAVDELILQVWVKGGDENMNSLFVCFDRESAPLAVIVAHKLRQWPPDVGSGCLAVQADVPKVVDLGCGILKTVGYKGPGSFQFKQDEESGDFFIIEMNTGRPALNYPLCEASGVEMVETLYCLAAGLPLPAARTVSHPGAKWVCWKTDLPSAYAHWKRGDLTCREWMASLRGRKWVADIQFDDLRPAWLDFVRKMRSGLSGKARKALKG
jgi:D-aspartate ligase